MSDVSFRNWTILKSTSIFDGNNYDIPGCYECFLLPYLMVSQTVEYLAEQYQVGLDSIIKTTTRGTPEIVKANITSADGKLCIKIRGILHTCENIDTHIRDILNLLDALSICVDAPFVCNGIRFISDKYGQIFIANRKPFGRGMAFEVDERGVASNKLQNDFNFYRRTSRQIAVGIKHYIAGITILGLEDQISGLTDAAYIQFCQGCEAICDCRDGRLNTICKYIAATEVDDSEQLQIIAHHVWQVRNKYYGHGDVEHNLKAITDYQIAYQATKQVLVARYLCKKLIDINAPSKLTLIREMRFYPERASEAFSGTVDELGKNFRIDYPRRSAKIFNEQGNEVKKVPIP